MTGFGLLLALSAASAAQTVDASVCDVVNHPKQFDGKTVRVKGVVQADFDSFVMRGESCSSMLWLSYPAGTKAKAGPATVVTMQLAANATGTPGLVRPAAAALVRSKDFDSFDSLLALRAKTSGMCLGCPKNDVVATLVGRVDGAENAGLTRDSAGRITGLDGFGNLNQYMARLVIESVSDVTAKELDYTKVPKVEGDGQGSNGKDYIALTRKTEEAFPKGTDTGMQIEQAIAAFGAPGQDNGVTVAFGDVTNVPEGEGVKGAKASADGLLLTVRVDAEKLKGDALSRAMAHQGAELLQLRATTVLGAKALELKAWQTTLLVVIGARQKTLTLPGGTVLWSESWPAADRNTIAGAALTQYVDDREETPR